MAFGIDINVIGLQKVIQGLKNPKLIDLKKIQKPLRQVIADSTAQNFDREQAGDGEKWKRLAPSTIKEKKRLGYSTKPLVRNGDLRKAATTGLKVKVDGNVLTTQITDKKLARIAGYQQTGTKTIPSRPFLVVSKSLSDSLIKIVSDEQQRLIQEIFQ